MGSGWYILKMTNERVGRDTENESSSRREEWTGELEKVISYKVPMVTNHAQVSGFSSKEKANRDIGEIL